LKQSAIIIRGGTATTTTAAIISGNTGGGIVVGGAAGAVRITQNSISGNPGAPGLGIDLRASATVGDGARRMMPATGTPAATSRTTLS
jgi:hypothetical protein